MYSRMNPNERINTFMAWFEASGHWIYPTRENAFKKWDLHGIENLPDAPKDAKLSPVIVEWIASCPFALMRRYRRIVEWARSRYTVKGLLIVDTGGIPSIYSRIEDLAFNKYLRKITQ
jgi:hypothetical protein